MPSFGAAGAAAITSPTPGTILPGSTATFKWTAGTGVAAYQLWLGTAGVGSGNLGVWGPSTATPTSVTVTGLPTKGGIVYARLAWDINGAWSAADYTYTASGSTAAALTSPTAGSTLSGSTATFTWTGISSIAAYQLWLGTTGTGSGNLGVYGPGASTPTSATVTGLPTNGVTVYARLAWDINGAWWVADYGYTAAQGSLRALSCASSSLTGAGTDACTVSLNAAAGTGGASVSLSSNNTAVKVPATVTVAAGSSSATFTATVLSVTAAQAVTLTATAGGVSKTCILELTPSVPTLAISATSLAFGDVDLKTASTQSLTLSSTGGSPVTVSSASVTGTGFTVSGVAFPITLTTGQTATLHVQFEPATVGAESGTLTISSNSSTGAKATVAMSGTGVSASVSLSWNAPASSPVPVEGYNVYRAPGGSSAYALLNSSLDTGTTFVDSTVQAGATYVYMVESVDASGGASVPSNLVSVTVP
jgi:hypothetical protein